jgi:hypothetical protein
MDHFQLYCLKMEQSFTNLKILNPNSLNFKFNNHQSSKIKLDGPTHNFLLKLKMVFILFYFWIISNHKSNRKINSQWLIAKLIKFDWSQINLKSNQLNGIGMKVNSKCQMNQLLTW